jgi:hypothetical protein
MKASSTSWSTIKVIALAGFISMLTLQLPAHAQAGRQILPFMEERLGLSEYQVRGGIGVLLAFAQAQLPKSQFEQLAKRLPSTEVLLEETHLRGIVSVPLDDKGDYEAVLGKLGIPTDKASQFASVVQEYLGTVGLYEERDTLSRVFD